MKPINLDNLLFFYRPVPGVGLMVNENNQAPNSPTPEVSSVVYDGVQAEFASLHLQVRGVIREDADPRREEEEDLAWEIMNGTDSETI